MENKKSIKLINLIEEKNISSYQLSLEQVNAILELKLQNTAYGVEKLKQRLANFLIL